MIYKTSRSDLQVIKRFIIISHEQSVKVIHFKMPTSVGILKHFKMPTSVGILKCMT